MEKLNFEQMECVKGDGCVGGVLLSMGSFFGTAATMSATMPAIGAMALGAIAVGGVIYAAYSCGAE